MNNNYEEQIVDFLAGKMTPEEKSRFSDSLKTTPELQQLFEEYEVMKKGLEINQIIASEHIDSMLLAKYAAAPTLLQEHEKNEVEAHLKKCHECQELLQLCRSEEQTVTTIRRVPTKSFFEILSDMFFTPRIRLSYAYGMIILILLALPAVYSRWNEDITPSMASVEIFPTTRSNDTLNPIPIASGQTTLEITFVLEVPPSDSDLFRFELYDPTEKRLFAIEDIAYQKVFAIDIPIRYLTINGQYRLQAEKGTGDGAEFIDSFIFTITLSD